jgi:hypothetical protein
LVVKGLHNMPYKSNVNVSRGINQLYTALYVFGEFWLSADPDSGPAGPATHGRFGMAQHVEGLYGSFVVAKVIPQFSGVRSANCGDSRGILAHDAHGL